MDHDPVGTSAWVTMSDIRVGERPRLPRSHDGTYARKILLPYCIKEVRPGAYILLNRNYVPVGTQGHEWVCYETYPVLWALPGLTPALAARMSSLKRRNMQMIHFYDDGCIPTVSARFMRAYLKRMDHLACIITPFVEAQR